MEISIQIQIIQIQIKFIKIGLQNVQGCEQMSKREVKEMSFLKILKSICVCGKLNTVRLGIPGSWTSVTEATFTQFSSSATFDSVSGPQAGSMTGFID